jgi:hypothetical protein
MKTLKFISLWMLPLILLVSCGPVATPRPQATTAPLTLPPTWTPTVPSLAPTFTDIPTFTPVPAFTPMSTPTKDPLAVLGERFQDSLFSPTGKWVARRDEKKLLVVNTEIATRTWTLPCELFKECSTIYPVLWRNTRFLYFAPAPLSGGAPDGISLVTALGVIDVKTGKWEIVLPDSDRHYDFSFSPEQDYLAYTQSSGAEADQPSVTVGVFSLVDRQQFEHHYTIDGVYAGNIVWSPFKPRFVFVITDPVKGAGVGYFDINTTFLKLALEMEPRDIILTDWGRDNMVSLEVKDWETQSRSYRLLNPFSGDLIGASITATPSESDLVPTPTSELQLSPTPTVESDSELTETPTP